MSRKVALTVMGAIVAGVVVFEYRNARNRHFFKRLFRKLGS